MLILSRKPGESIVIDGRIIVTILRGDRDEVKVGVDAPPDVPVFRQELYAEVRRNNREALTEKGRPLLRLPSSRPPSPSAATPASREVAELTTNP
jgi:carbon storage regulator